MTPTTSTLADPDHLWQAALGELALQMTRATFDTWLRDTRYVGIDEDTHTLVIAAKNGYAVEWLENRLMVVIQRTLQRLTSNGTTARFVVAPPPPPRPAPPAPSNDSDPSAPTPDDTWTPPDFDPSDTKKVAGWIPLPEYATLFWAPLLGVAAWRIWELVRRNDKRREKSALTPPLRFSIPQLARLIPCAQQTITGRNVRCEPDAPGAQHLEARGGRGRIGGVSELIWARHYPGALEILERAGLAEIERSGQRKGAAVTISVLVNLPLLHPSQVDALPADLQAAHDHWIGEHGMDPAAWL